MSESALAAGTAAPADPLRSGFEEAQRVASMLTRSSLVPAAYRAPPEAEAGSPAARQAVANCMVALELARRAGLSPLAVMQNVDVIAGRPSWRATFLIATCNACGRFERLRFRMSGEGPSRACVAWTRERPGGEELEGPPVSMEMAAAEGWVGRPGSKWRTMPELMLRYRAAALFSRLYAPDLLMGMSSGEEALDAAPEPEPEPAAGGVSGLKHALAAPAAPAADGLFAGTKEAAP